MKNLVTKLSHAIATKDWRLVEEAWAMADCMTNSKPIVKPIQHPVLGSGITHNKEILGVLERAKQWCEHSEHYHPDLASDIEKTIKEFYSDDQPRTRDRATDE